jgi:hypothetical protein
MESNALLALSPSSRGTDTPDGPEFENAARRQTAGFRKRCPTWSESRVGLRTTARSLVVEDQVQALDDDDKPGDSCHDADPIDRSTGRQAEQKHSQDNCGHTRSREQEPAIPLSYRCHHPITSKRSLLEQVESDFQGGLCHRRMALSRQDRVVGHRITKEVGAPTAPDDVVGPGCRRWCRHRHAPPPRRGRVHDPVEPVGPRVADQSTPER